MFVPARSENHISRVVPAATPLVSVVVATYNYGHFIAETLLNLQAQTYPHWECIIVDDGSTDNTSEVVRDFIARDARIKYIHQSNQKQAAARNNALRHIRGDYVQFLDADDLLEDQKIERQVEYLECHPEVDIVYGNVRYFTTENPHERRYWMGEPDEPWMPETSGTGTQMLVELVKRNVLVINAALLRRVVIERVGFFDETLAPVEDWDFFLRCAIAEQQFVYADLDGTHALVRSHSASTSKNLQSAYAAQLRMRAKLAEMLQDDTLRSANAELNEFLNYLLLLEHVGSGRRTEAVKHCLQTSVTNDRFHMRLRWLLYAALAPLATRKQLSQVASTSVRGIMRNKIHGGRQAPL